MKDTKFEKKICTGGKIDGALDSAQRDTETDARKANTPRPPKFRRALRGPRARRDVETVDLIARRHAVGQQTAGDDNLIVREEGRKHAAPGHA